MTRRKFFLGAAAAALAPYSAFAAPPDLRTIARDAWLYALPLFEMAATRARLLSMGAAQNTIYNRRNLADASSRSVTSPNNDTLYSTAWLDLTAGPVTATFPEFGQRYFSLQLMDMYTNNFAVLGTRTIGSSAAKFTIVGPNDAIAASDRNVAALADATCLGARPRAGRWSRRSRGSARRASWHGHRWTEGRAQAPQPKASPRWRRTQNGRTCLPKPTACWRKTVRRSLILRCCSASRRSASAPMPSSTPMRSPTPIARQLPPVLRMDERS